MYRLRKINNQLRVMVGVACLLLIAVVPFSRNYLGAHWLTDVLGGVIFGLLCLAVLVYFYFGKGKFGGEGSVSNDRF